MKNCNTSASATLEVRKLGFPSKQQQQQQNNNNNNKTKTNKQKRKEEDYTRLKRV